jgi:hypothetical protein
MLTITINDGMREQALTLDDAAAESLEMYRQSQVQYRTLGDGSSAPMPKYKDVPTMLVERLKETCINHALAQFPSGDLAAAIEKQKTAAEEVEETKTRVLREVFRPLVVKSEA